MRVFFYFAWEFSKFSHALAISMKKKYGVTDFSGLVVQKEELEYLKNQKDIDYSHLYYVFAPYRNFEEEVIDKELLSKYESLYGNPTLWNLVYADKEFLTYANKPYSQEECMKLIQRYIRFTEEYLNEAKPDYIIMENVVSMPSYVLFAVAKARGIDVRIFTIARIGGRTNLSQDPFVGFEDTLKTFHDKNEVIDEKYINQAKEYITSFRSKKVESDYAFSPENYAEKHLSLPAALQKLPRALEFIKQDFSSKEDIETFDRGTSFASKVSWVAKRNLLKYRTKFSKFFDVPVPGEDYVFFPLHLEPEMATTVRAPMYINQLPIIDNIAKSLPITYKLYVKDHPLTFTFGYGRSISYYETLKAIPNVRVLDPKLDAYPILKDAKLVTTVTGTAGWEGAILKKPVITFGDVFYNDLKGVSYCEDTSKLPNLVFKCLAEPYPDDEDLIRMCASIYEHSFKGDYLAFCGLNGWLSTEEVLIHPDFEQAFDFVAKDLGLEKAKKAT